MSICVCAKCKKPWKGPASPARCSDCGEVSFPIAIQIGSEAISAETRAKLSASSKKLWQDPEYRAGRLPLIQAGIPHLRLGQKYLRRLQEGGIIERQ